MKREREIKGNMLIYCLFQISNILLAVLGFFTFGISIYLVFLSKSLNFFNISFFFFGVILIILAYYGCKMRNAPVGNLIYSVVLSAMFFFDMVATIMILVDSTMVNNIMLAYDVSDSTKIELQRFIAKNIKIVDDLLLIILLILFCVVIFSWWYRKSLMQNQADWNRSLIDDNVIEEYLNKKKEFELRKI